MSSLLKNPVYTPKQLELQWYNSIHQGHDLFCGCNKPVLHLLHIINRRGNAPKPEKDIANIQCLLTGEKEDNGDEDVFQPGELEELFKEDSGDAEEETPGTSDG